MILDCYRLAKSYGIDPDIFLAKPMSRIMRHRMWTAKLIKETSSDDA